MQSARLRMTGNWKCAPEEEKRAYGRGQLEGCVQAEMTKEILRDGLCSA